GGEAVADGKGARRNAYALGHRVARGEHEITPAQVEAADGRGEEGQEAAVAVARSGQALEKGSDDAAPLDDRRHGARHTEQGEEIGRGEKLAEDLETALPAAHAREPVMDEGDPRNAVADPSSQSDAIVGHATGGRDGARGGAKGQNARVRCRQ